LFKRLPESKVGGLGNVARSHLKTLCGALRVPPRKGSRIPLDDALAGFGVGVFPTGCKVYVAQYRQNGRSRRANLGEHGRLAPGEARSLAKKLLGAVETGDPIEARREARAVRTFCDVAEDFLRQHVAAKRKGRTEASYRETLEKHVYPAIKSRRIAGVRRSDMAKLHSAMEATPSAANHVLAVVSSVWNWAARRDEVGAGANPCLGIERYAENARERYLTSEEFARLGDALRLAETTGLEWTVDETKPKANRAPKPENRARTLDPFAVAAIRLLIFTGARLREILHPDGITWTSNEGFCSCQTARPEGSPPISLRRRFRSFRRFLARATRISSLAQRTASPART
jgi:hypothetical protein